MELSTVVIKVQSNDIQAWDELYNSTYKRVYYYAYELTGGNKADADDLTQTAYIKAYQSINTLKNPEKFMAWILTIVKNQHTNTVTRKKKAYSLNDEFYANTLKVDDNFLPDYMVEQDDTRKILKDLIYELPEEQRDCILFHFHYEMSIVDVAATLNCSPNTVKSRMRYGKSRLKEKVLSLEKRDGIRLHSFVPLGLLFAKDMSFVTDQLTIPPFVAVEAAGTATVATTTAVKSGIFTTAKVKAVAAVTAAAVVTGGVAYVALHQEPEVPAVVVESQPIVEELPSPVIFADATIEEAVRLALEIHDNEVYQEDLDNIYMLTIEAHTLYFNETIDSPVQIPETLEDLDQFPNLNCLIFCDEDTGLLDTIPLMLSMRIITVYPPTIQPIENQTWLSNFPNLTVINISGVGDFSVLNQFENLKTLFIETDEDLILDISQLQNLSSLTLSPWDSTTSTNITTSTSMPNLQHLDIRPCDSLEVLTNTPNLKMLSIESAVDLDLVPITSLTKLNWLSLNIYNSTQDVSLLEACPDLVYCTLNESMTATLPDSIILDVFYSDPQGELIYNNLYTEVTGSIIDLE